VSRSTLSRRVREFIGVALFAAALIWIVALVSYEPSDPVWFFSIGGHAAPLNFAGRVGAFLAELSFQLFGYASYVIPALLVVVGWHCFWCRDVDAAATKATGATLLFTCISAFLSLVFGTLEVSGKPFRAGGYAGEWLAKELSEYLNRTGSVIAILTLIFLSVIMSTQFSFGRFFGALTGAVGNGVLRALGSLRQWREDRRRERQRREVIAKHTKKGPAAAPVGGGDGLQSVANPPPDLSPGRAGRKRDADDQDELAASLSFGGPKSFAPPKPPKLSVPAPPLSLADPYPVTKAPAARRKGDYVLPPLALLDAPKTEHKIDERELMDGARLL